jgi:hypothetical protein
MDNLLRDQIWQFVGVVLSGIAIVISIITYRKQRQNKELSYLVVTVKPLLWVDEEVLELVQVLFSGTPVQTVHLVTVWISNTGKVPIRSEDFLEPITIRFGKKAEVLKTEIMGIKPLNLKVEAFSSYQTSVVKPTLINAGEWMRLRSLVANLGKIEADARIVGISDVKGEDPVKTLRRLTKTNIRIDLVVLFVLGVTLVFHDRLAGTPERLIFFILSLVLIWQFFVKWKRAKLPIYK